MLAGLATLALRASRILPGSAGGLCVESSWSSTRNMLEWWKWLANGLARRARRGEALVETSRSVNLSRTLLRGARRDMLVGGL